MWPLSPILAKIVFSRVTSPFKKAQLSHFYRTFGDNFGDNVYKTTYKSVFLCPYLV